MKEEFKERLLRRFVDDPDMMSRNKNFHAYLDPKVRWAARTGRILRSLREDLGERDLAWAAVRRDPSGNGVDTFILELHYDNGRRLTYLNRVEITILLEDARVERRLRALLNEAEAA